MTATIAIIVDTVGVGVKAGDITLKAGDIQVVMCAADGISEKYDIEMQASIKLATALIDQLTHGRDQLQERLDRLREQQ